MKEIDKKIKKYEPMMRSLIRRYKVKRDYEDILQLLRIKTWEVLRDNKYKKIYRNKEGDIIEAKFSTWIYKVLSGKLQDILKVDYGVKIKKDDKEIKDLSIEKQSYYYLQNPSLFEGHYNQLTDDKTVREIICKLDFELYYDLLSKEDKLLLDTMKNCNGNKKKTALELKCTTRNVYRKLLKLKNKYKKYLIKGETNG